MVTLTCTELEDISKTRESRPGIREASTTVTRTNGTVDQGLEPSRFRAFTRRL